MWPSTRSMSSSEAVRCSGGTHTGKRMRRARRRRLMKDMKRSCKAVKGVDWVVCVIGCTLTPCLSWLEDAVVEPLLGKWWEEQERRDQWGTWEGTVRVDRSLNKVVRKRRVKWDTHRLVVFHDREIRWWNPYWEKDEKSKKEKINDGHGKEL